MTYTLIGILVAFLILLFLDSRRKAQRISNAILAEKRAIAEDSGMTASLGVFSPDIQTTVIIGASEELGLFYYRMLRQAKVINKSRINLANLAKVEFLINGAPQAIRLESAQPTTSLAATEISERVLTGISGEALRQIERAAMRVCFYDDAGNEKSLEITTLRSGDERQRFERMQLLKNTVWWVAFLQLASKQARRVRAHIEEAAEISK